MKTDSSPAVPRPTPAGKRKPTVALALGAGGAKGLSHIGVIEELEAQGYEIVAIAGTSMGALIGGIHARQHSHRLAWFSTTTHPPEQFSHGTKGGTVRYWLIFFMAPANVS